MENTSSLTRSIVLTWIVLCSWFALISQFYLIIENRTDSIPETILRYFSFFTILTNILIALCSTFLLICRQGVIGRFFTTPSTQTALAVYITIVGIVYNLILRFLWMPQGLQKIADELLHTVIPLSYILYWLFFSAKAHLQWKGVLPWLIYPLVYLCYSLVRGAITGVYPYPFVDVGALGYDMVAVNSLVLIMAFLVVSALFIFIGNTLFKKQNNSPEKYENVRRS